MDAKRKKLLEELYSVGTHMQTVLGLLYELDKSAGLDPDCWNPATSVFLAWSHAQAELVLIEHELEAQATRDAIRQLEGADRDIVHRFAASGDLDLEVVNVLGKLMTRWQLKRLSLDDVIDIIYCR